MHRFFIPKPFKQEMQITGRDAHHIMDVLRMVPGDQLQVVADDGISFVGEITAANTNTVTVAAREILRETHEPDVRISLLQGLAKGEKMELIIQKAVEIGVAEIFPLAMDHSVVVLDRSKAEKKTERWQKIALQAAMQSRRGIIPQVCDCVSFNSAAELSAQNEKTVIFYEMGGQSVKTILSDKPKTVGMFIGSEGGFEAGEVEKVISVGGVAATLGRRILRAETAPLAALSIIMYQTDNF